MKLIVNEDIKYSNLYVKPLAQNKKKDFIGLSEIEDKKITEINKEDLLKYKLDEYRLPPIITRSLREMDKDELIEICTTRTGKLVSYFQEEKLFDPSWFKRGDRVRIFLHLVNTDRPESISKVRIEDKFSRLSRSKAVATSLFKIGKCKKAGKLYQKISGYFNFGDVDVVIEGENKDSPEYKKIKEDLYLLKKQCFVNSMICKYKIKDFGTVSALADQIIEMDQNCTKAYYWKAKALYDQEMYQPAVKAITMAFKIDPNNEEVKKEYISMTEGYEKYKKTEKDKYSKLFKK